MPRSSSCAWSTPGSGRRRSRVENSWDVWRWRIACSRVRDCVLSAMFCTRCWIHSVRHQSTRGAIMNFLDWVLSSALFLLYLVCLFTVCLLTFRKGHFILGILGIIFPFLWLIGAVL